MKLKNKSSVFELTSEEYWIFRTLLDASGMFGDHHFHSIRLIHHKPGVSIKIDWRKFFKEGVRKVLSRKKTKPIKYCEEKTEFCQGIADFSISSKHYKRDSFDSKFICYKCIRYRMLNELLFLLRKLQPYRIIDRMDGIRIKDFKTESLASILTFHDEETDQAIREASKKFIQTVNDEQKNPGRNKEETQKITRYFE